MFGWQIIVRGTPLLCGKWKEGWFWEWMRWMRFECMNLCRNGSYVPLSWPGFPLLKNTVFIGYLHSENLISCWIQGCRKQRKDRIYSRQSLCCSGYAGRSDYHHYKWSPNPWIPINLPTSDHDHQLPWSRDAHSENQRTPTVSALQTAPNRLIFNSLNCSV